jgi:hypothetical protein
MLVDFPVRELEEFKEQLGDCHIRTACRVECGYIELVFETGSVALTAPNVLTFEGTEKAIPRMPNDSELEVAWIDKDILSHLFSNFILLASLQA